MKTESQYVDFFTFANRDKVLVTYRGKIVDLISFGEMEKLIVELRERAIATASSNHQR